MARHPLDLSDWYLSTKTHPIEVPGSGYPGRVVNHRQYGWSATLMEPAEDLITEMMEAYWRQQADRLDPDAGALLHRALDVFAESRIARLSSEGDTQETS